MKITINYESKFSLSMIDKNGDMLINSGEEFNKGKIPSTKDIFKKDNTFLENVKKANLYNPKYKYADISKNTVLGILARLVGEVRRLDALESEHPIIKISDKITYKNFNTSFQNEIMLLHTRLNEVRDNGGGIVDENKNSHFLLSKNDLSETLLSVFYLDNQKKIVDFLNKMENNDKSLFFAKYKENINARTLVKEFAIVNHKDNKERYKDLITNFHFEDTKVMWKEIKNVLVKGKKENVLILINEVLNNPEMNSSDVTSRGKELNLDIVSNIYGVLLALKIAFLQANKMFEKEFNGTLNKRKDSIVGLAPLSGGLTIKDYYKNFLSEKKKSWSFPYSLELKKDLFNQAELKEFNTSAKLGVIKECGVLEISIDIDRKDAEELCEKINNAGVNTFYMGKKGLAYIDKIDLE